MKVTGEVNEFLHEMSKELAEEKVPNASKVAEKIKALIIDDTTFFQKEVTDAIIRRSVSLDNSWSSYILSDVDIYYFDDMLKFSDRLEMFGIRGLVPAIRGGDRAVALVYRFSSFDAFGRALDTVTGFHIGLLQENGIHKDRKIFMYG